MFKVGQRVRILTLQEFNDANKFKEERNGNFYSIEGDTDLCFSSEMRRFCGMTGIITAIITPYSWEGTIKPRYRIICDRDSDSIQWVFNDYFIVPLKQDEFNEKSPDKEFYLFAIRNLVKDKIEELHLTEKDAYLRCLILLDKFYDSKQYENIKLNGLDALKKFIETNKLTTKSVLEGEIR